MSVAKLARLTSKIAAIAKPVQNSTKWFTP
jgi:hypothetical protein